MTVLFVSVSVLLGAQSLCHRARLVADAAPSKRNKTMVLAGVLLVGAVLLGPLFAIAGALVGYARSVLLRRSRLRHRDQQIRTSLAEVVDLFAVALANGHNLYAATHRVASWSTEPLGQALRSCLSAVERGQPLADSLEQMSSRLGPAVQPLVAALVAHERYGAPITQNLAGLAVESRRARRHHAEVLARRLPVTLLGPLIVCILPAFLLLTVVPLVVESLGSFSESFGL